MATVASLRCARCGKAHPTSECPLPFYRTETIAEARQRRFAEKAAREAEYKARQAEREARQAERKQKQEEWEAKQAEKKAQREAWEAKKATKAAKYEAWMKRCAKYAEDKEDGDTESTMASTAAYEDDVERIAAASKRVLRAEKKLRDVVKLEALQKDPLQKLDKLQLEKISRKRDFLIERMAAWAVAKAEARVELNAVSV